MPRISLSPLRLGAIALAVAPTLTACGESSGLLPATFENAVDTAVVYALQGTPIGTPSGFDIVTGLAVRPEIAQQFDFAFEIDSTGNAILYPAGLLGGSSVSGFLLTDETFDEIDRAPLDDYVVDSVLAVTDSLTFVGRSRPTSALCSAFIGSIPRYGKFEVLEVDLTARTLTVRYLINLNCGYRDLTPGLPTS